MFLLAALTSLTIASAAAPAEAEAARPASDAELALVCVTEMPTTSMILQPVAEKDVLHLTVMHHHGTNYMPIHEGVVVPNDLAILDARAKVLAALGTMYEFDLPKSGCKLVADKVFQCNNYGSPGTVIGGKKVSLLSLYSSATKDVSFAGTYDYVTLTMFLEIDGQTYFVPMRYFENECLHKRLERPLPPLSAPSPMRLSAQ